MRPMRTILQTGQEVRIVPPLPAVEGLPTDAKVAAGQSGIVPVGTVVIKLPQAQSSFLT
jgi:hypothetical protein